MAAILKSTKPHDFAHCVCGGGWEENKNSRKLINIITLEIAQLNENFEDPARKFDLNPPNNKKYKSLVFWTNYTILIIFAFFAFFFLSFAKLSPNYSSAGLSSALVLIPHPPHSECKQKNVKI